MSQISSFVFHTLNADGSIYGTGCFSYEGPPDGVDIQYNSGTSAGGTANKMLSFWYHDPVVGTLDISALINFNWTNGWQGAHYRFDFNLWNFPQNSHDLTAGQAQPSRLGPISGHRGNGDISGQKILQWPTLATTTVTTGGVQAAPSGTTDEPTEITVIPPVDLVVVIDSSVSMKDEAAALSAAVDTAIEAARTSCPSDLRVTYLGIEGVFKETLFSRTVRDYLTGAAGAAEADLRGRKRGTVAEGGAQEGDNGYDEGANLRRANLSGANLSGANLSFADLSRANLSGANLSDANIYYAYLSFADLSDANLSGANLNFADLTCANLSGADLSGTNLENATLNSATMPDSDRQ